MSDDVSPKTGEGGFPFRKGDVVQLKSGGPRMTICGTERSGRGELLARVVYFKESEEKVVYDSIIPEALEPSA